MIILIVFAYITDLPTKNLARIPEMAYQVKMDEKRKLTWHATIDGQEVVETVEPQTGAWRRFQAWFMKIAPEKQL